MSSTHFRTRVALSAAVVALLGGAAAAQAAVIEDEAGFFSADARKEAAAIGDRIEQRTSPTKQVAVVTTASLPDGADAQAAAEALFRRRRLDGVLIYAVKAPHKLVVTTGLRTQERFTRGDANDLRQAMLAEFGKQRYDQGLLSGMRFAERRLVAAFPADGSAPIGGANRRQDGHGALDWLPLLGGVAVIGFMVYLFKRARSGPTAPSVGSRFGGGAMSGTIGSGGGYGVPPGAGGMGIGKAVLGGVAGAVAGNYLYDHLVRDRDDHGGGGGSGGGGGYDGGGSDAGAVGGSVGGGGGSDWGDSGGGGGGFDSGGGGFDGGGGGGGDW